MTTTRVFADRRHGVDRRAVRRRLAVAGLPRDPSFEAPGEHLRNALQLLGSLQFEREPVFDAAVARLRRALELLEHRH